MNSTEKKMDTTKEKRWKFFNTGIWLALVGITIGVCILLIIYWEYISNFQIIVFLGLFLTAVLAGSPVPVPTPCMALTFTLGSQFSPVVIGIIASTGAAIGSMLVYFTARTGRHFFPSLNISDPTNKIYSSRLGLFLQKIKLPRFMNFVNKRGLLGVFLFSIFPNPLLFPMLLTTGINRTSTWKVTIAVWLGHSVLFLTLAFLGHYGLGSLLKYFGVTQLP